ncbi:MAG: methionyl-tRNA formyltransferase [Spirochaetota bacterium]|jgi:methionyl-tRNA formyltransferase|nr:methionyl-tRNA formyltransferase [Spirochaetota bacterium]
MRILFFGTPEYTCRALDCLSGYAAIAGIVTGGDTKSGRGQTLLRPAPALWAEERAIPLFQAPNLRDAGCIESLRELKPDLGVVFAYGRILPRAIFALPAMETINIHLSLLPAWRGASPVEAALLAGARTTGVSIQRITEKLDAGDILDSAEVPVDPLDHYPELFARLMSAALALLPRAIESLQAGNARFIPQDANQATFCVKIAPDQRRIDWRGSAETVYNTIRAFAGSRTAWAFFRGKKFFFHRARPAAPDEEPDGSAGDGAIILCREKLLARCGDGRYIVPTEAQIEGKRRAEIAECVRGLRPAPGECFT